MSESAAAAGLGIQESAELLLVLSTAPNSAVAERIARQLVEERLIACANLVPGLMSVFRWESAVRSEPEVLLLMKTGRSSLEELAQRLPELHPYDVPEMIVLPIESGLEAYCRWALAETGRHSS